MTKTAKTRFEQRRARPFLKWAGGKSQLLSQFAHHYPSELTDGQIRRYVEPFLGGGAVFLDVVQRFSIPEIFLFDINRELILAYRVVQREPEELIARLRAHREAYMSGDDAGRRRYFYATRDLYNEQQDAIDYQRFSAGWIERSAQMLFLNKTCYNGLFRVNSRGKFNVPHGRYRRPTIFSEQNIMHVSALLQPAILQIGRFDSCAAVVDDETFVYFDPPYRPISSTANFTAYSSGGFSEADQVALAQFYAHLNGASKAKLMLSNADPSQQDSADTFFDSHYADFHIDRVYASRMINTKANGRGKIPELLITNY